MPKRIMHLTYDMRIGGTEMVIKNIVEGLDKTRFEQSLYCIEEPIGPWGLALQQNGVQINARARKPGFDVSLIRAVRKHVKQHNIDILHCHQYTPWVYGAMAAFGLKTKVIFTEHGRFYPDSSSWKRRFVNPVLSLFTHKITAISQATKQALIDFEFIYGSRIDVIYNGIHPLEIDSEQAKTIQQEMNIGNHDIVFGTIARLDPIKNHKMMLNAFAKVLSEKPNCKLIVVGDGELMDALQSQVKTLNIAESVIFTGYIAYPKNHLAVFNIFLLSSLSEGTSMTLLEAMSLSKPCVVTNAGGNKEIVLHEETGLVTDNNDMEAFASAMLTLASERDQMQAYGKMAKQRFDCTFTNATMAESYERIYSD